MNDILTLIFYGVILIGTLVFPICLWMVIECFRQKNWHSTNGKITNTFRAGKNELVIEYTFVVEGIYILLQKKVYGYEPLDFFKYSKGNDVKVFFNPKNLQKTSFEPCRLRPVSIIAFLSFGCMIFTIKVIQINGIPGLWVLAGCAGILVVKFIIDEVL